jgi:peptide/nickel transport system substrate-binding protein
MKANAAFEGEAVESTWLNTFYITINSQQEGLSDIRVRQAIAHCIDREALIRAVPAGLAEPAYTLLPPGDELNYNADQPRYELDRARSAELLAEAGYPDGLSFPVGSGNYYPWDQFAQAIQGQLAECNINLDLQLLETAAWYEFQGRADNGIAFNHWPYEIPDPAYVMDGGFSAAAFYPDSCCNFSWYTSPELEEMLAEARVEQDPVTRGEMYQAIDELVIYDLALWVPLWHPQEWYATSAKLGGFLPPVVVHPRYLEPQYYWSKTGE